MADPFPTPDDANAIRGLILAQIEAFRADDAERAFSFASVMIQQMFGTPEVFLDMVRTHYSIVYRPWRIVFGSLTPDGNRHAVQLVHLLDGEGRRRTARYELFRDERGWRINGCLLDWQWGSYADPSASAGPNPT